jgi:phenylacetate-CoA ligase
MIPDGGGDSGRQVSALKDLGVSAICCTPHRFLHLLERAQNMGVNLRDLPLRVGLFITERWGEGIRKRIEDSAGIRAYEIYGLPEASGVAVGSECHQRTGSHVFEDQFVPEIIDPESGQPLPDGHEGELVITTLGAEATPLIRYRTHDRTTILAEPCACGRTMRRIGRVAGGDDRLFAIQGVEVLPSQVEAAILAVESTLSDYRILLSQEAGVDRMEVEVEISSQVLGDRVGPLESLQSDLQHEIERAVGIAAAVHLVEPHTVARKYGDSGRVIDKRSS